MRELIASVSLFLLATLPTGCGAPATRLNVDPETRVAIDGWDPVSYRPEGGGAPQKGDPRWTAEHDGAVYQFASPAHRDLFLTDPARFAPAYGGWCAYGIKEGHRATCNHDSFLIEDDSLLFFYDDGSTDTRDWWLKGDRDAARAQADEVWAEMEAESR